MPSSAAIGLHRRRTVARQDHRLDSHALQPLDRGLGRRPQRVAERDPAQEPAVVLHADAGSAFSGFLLQEGGRANARRLALDDARDTLPADRAEILHRQPRAFLWRYYSVHDPL
jgi:hypothetical protein